MLSVIMALKHVMIEDTAQTNHRFPPARYIELPILANGTAHYKKCKNLLEYQNLLLVVDIWG